MPLSRSANPAPDPDGGRAPRCLALTLGKELVILRADVTFWRSRKNRPELQETTFPTGLEQWAENPRSGLRSRSKRPAAPGTEVFNLVGRTWELIQRLRTSLVNSVLNISSPCFKRWIWARLRAYACDGTEAGGVLRAFRIDCVQPLPRAPARPSQRIFPVSIFAESVVRVNKALLVQKVKDFT